MKSKKIVIVGATSCIAENCARLWVNQQHSIEMVLIGRDVKKLEVISADLRVRNPAAIVNTLRTDFTNPSSIDEIVKEITKKGRVDIVLIAHGHLPNQSVCIGNASYTYESLLINGVSPALFAESFSRAMEEEDHGSIAIIGSVAGDRGRKSNYIYGSSKSLLDKYCQGLQHRLYRTNVTITLIKPGPTDTPMTRELKQNRKKLTPVNVASKEIVKAIDDGLACAYVPKKWGLIMLIIRLLPGFIFNRLEI